MITHSHNTVGLKHILYKTHLFGNAIGRRFYLPIVSAHILKTKNNIMALRKCFHYFFNRSISANLNKKRLINMKNHILVNRLNKCTKPLNTLIQIIHLIT